MLQAAQLCGQQRKSQRGQEAVRTAVRPIYPFLARTLATNTKDQLYVGLETKQCKYLMLAFGVWETAGQVSKFGAELI